MVGKESKVNKTKIYSAINQSFGLGSRIGDMDLWNEVNNELALMFFTYNSLHELGGLK